MAVLIDNKNRGRVIDTLSVSIRPKARIAKDCRTRLEQKAAIKGTTIWIDLTAPSAIQVDLLKSLDVTGWSNANYLTCYNAFVTRLLSLESAAYTGVFSLVGKVDREERISILGECKQIEEHITSLRKAIKEEEHFNRQVEMNAKIKEFESPLSELLERL